MTTWWPYARVAAATLTLAAIVTQLIRTLQVAAASPTPWGGDVATVATNFFSFFTILSNVLAAVVLVIAAAWSWGHRAAAPPRWLATALICISTYMIVTGLVYNVLLRGVELPQGTTVWWSNEVLHVVTPLFLLIDVLVAPGRRTPAWRTVPAVAVFPVAWIAYTLIRAPHVIAPATGVRWWYPYPFLDPHLVPGGYLGVAAYIVAIAVVILAVATFVVWARRRDAATAAR